MTPRFLPAAGVSLFVAALCAAPFALSTYGVDVLDSVGLYALLALSLNLVLGEAGLYIKELVSGDSGRTVPSLAEILKKKAHVTSLDVTQVEGAKEGE